MFLKAKPLLVSKGRTLLVVCLLIPFITSAQKPLKIKYTQAGIFALGIRVPFAVTSTPDGTSVLQGLGCESRLQLGRHYNTEWFVEYVRGQYGNASVRSDTHIGGEFMLYPQFKMRRVQPFVAAGPMADFSSVHEQSDKSNNASRWSLAAAAGLGMHINITWRTDITIAAKYLVHFGEKISPVYSGDEVFYLTDSGVDGQLMLTLSMNFKMFDLWKRIRW